LLLVVVVDVDVVELDVVDVVAVVVDWVVVATNAICININKKQINYLLNLKTKQENSLKHIIKNSCWSLPALFLLIIRTAAVTAPPTISNTTVTTAKILYNKLYLLLR
jgi:hypothetical protein